MTTTDRVGIIDDDLDQAEVTSVLVEEVGFRPVIIKGLLVDIDSAIAEAKKQSDLILCDHRLQPKKRAKFYGAELVARLNEAHFPAVLVSQFVKMDVDVTIRMWRRSIPVILTRDEVVGDRLLFAFNECKQEIAGEPLPHRIPTRTLVRIATTDKESGESVVDAIVPAWRPNEAVRFPRKLIDSSLHGLVKPGARFFAKINIGADDADELFFSDFERATTPGDDDGLG